MGYYRGDYYRGDYYRGDLKGFFKKAGKVLGGVAKAALPLVPGVGGIVGTASALLKAKGPAQLVQPTQASIGGLIGTAVRVGARVLPKVATGVGAVSIVRELAPGLFGPDGKKRRTMNHLNPRALTRASRRVEGFVKKARKLASPLGYTFVRRGSARCAPRKRRCR